MSHLVNTPIAVTYQENSTFYLISLKHRGNPTRDISVWSVDHDSEISCFSRCFQNQWHDNTHGWSFMPSIDIKHFQIIGYNLRSPELIIAKFVAGQDFWHGYPADIRHKPTDKPHPKILLSWLTAGHISKATMVRIKQGQL